MFNVQDSILNTLFHLTLFEVIKWFFVAGMILYTIFAYVIVRQVKVMSEAIEDPMNGVIAVFAWVHLIAAGVLVWLAITVL